MSLSHSPKVVTDGLVFYYDMNNTQKSWKGRPTTNLLPSPSTNGRFTTANTWGTYNTNQYNGAQYFSIGTIASVSGNVVTTAAAHPLRTFDVVRAQSTGGGVTAGTDYLIKKISNTQFTLHAYNGDQTGAYGYFSGGYHKVHESLGLDQRVAVNATSFPTMWWGAPHMPNSHLVKEIVVGAGPQGQNTMRLHVPSVDGVVDGMAYGVDSPVTAGDVVNVSFWIRSNYPGKNLGYSTYFGASASYGNSCSTTLEWQRISYQWTASATYNFISYWWPDGSTDRPYWIDMCDLQVEINTGTAGSTPFVAGTRSNTQAIVDLTGSNTVTATGLTYAPDNTFSFNGSNHLGSGYNATLNDFTIGVWFKDTGSPAYARIIDKIYNTGTMLMRNSSTANSWGGGVLEGTAPYGIFLTLTDGQWHYLVSVRNGTTHTLYGDGITNTISNTVSSSALNANQFGIGAWSDNSTPSQSFNGSISNVQIYNRALSVSEVKQNFNALRGRYSI